MSRQSHEVDYKIIAHVMQRLPFSYMADRIVVSAPSIGRSKCYILDGIGHLISGRRLRALSFL